ncbi:hypothetical protein [Streptomyces sp. NRRL B-24484]|uniref:hypothetical protein n=1 Tax=Streptomyces sp. NRRL B-24484 TaxID=1463833 RepID=UPI000AA9AF4E|nr:hypothetical protein [Streptomyces sp. NRRL B-24484]
MKSKLVGLISAGVLAALALGLSGAAHGAVDAGRGRGEAARVTLASDNPTGNVIGSH